MSVAFDTLTYARKLKEAGFTERQAEAQAEALADIVDERLATKQDIEALRLATKQDIEEIKRDMKELELRLKYDLTVRLGAMIFASSGLTIAVLGWLIRM